MGRESNDDFVISMIDCLSVIICTASYLLHMWVRTDIVVTEMFIVDSDLQTCISLLLVLGLIVSTHYGNTLRK